MLNAKLTIEIMLHTNFCKLAKIRGQNFRKRKDMCSKLNYLRMNNLIKANKQLIIIKRMVKCPNCKTQNSKLSVLCLQEECRYNRRICAQCFINQHLQHKHITFNRESQILKKWKINSEKADKEAYQLKLKNFMNLYKEVINLMIKKIHNIRRLMDGYLQAWEDNLLIKPQIYLESLEDNSAKFLQIFQQDEGEQVEKLSKKILLLQEQQMIKIDQFIEEQSNQSEKIKLIFDNSHKKMKDYFENLNRQIFHKRLPGRLLFDPVLEEIIELKEASEIQMKLQKVSPQNLKKLEIICETRPSCLTGNSVEFISKMKNLTHLSLVWCKNLTPDKILPMIKNLPNIQYLGIPGSQFNKDCVYQLIQSCPKIKQLHILCDMVQYMYRFTAALYFLGPNKVQRQLSLDINSCYELALNLTELTTMWIGNCEEEKCSQILKLMENRMEHLILGQFDGQKRSISNESIEKLNKMTRIKHFLFLRTFPTMTVINNDETDFQEFFSNNKNLIQFEIIECNGIRDAAITKIAQNCPQIQKFGIDNCEQFLGQSLVNFKNIKELYLINCDGIEVQPFRRFLQINNSIECLSLRGNPWVDDNLLKDIGNLFSLTYLNLAYTKTRSGLKELKQLTKLRALNVCNTYVTGVSLRMITSQLKKLQKINIAGLNGEDMKPTILDEDVTKIIQNLQNLTHLSIYKCPQITDKGLKFVHSSIKCMWITGCNISTAHISNLRNKKIYIINT